MAVTDRSSFDPMLKDEYLPPIRDQINRETVVLDLLKPRKTVVEGRKFIVPLITAKHKGITSRSGASKAANKLPTAARQTYQNATYWMKYHYGRIEVDGPSMRSSDTDKGAFIQSLDAEIQGLTKAMPMELNRQIWGDGLNRLTATTAASGTSLTCSDIRHLDVGQLLTSIDDSDGSVTVASNAIESITPTTGIAGTVVMATNMTGGGHVYADDGMYSEAVDATTTPWRNGMTGLNALIYHANVTDMSTNYVGNINRSTAGNGFWKANRVHNSGTLRHWSIGLLQQSQLASQNNKYGGGTPTIALMDANIWSTYGSLLVGDKRFRGDVMLLDGGWQYLEFGGTKMLWDKDATPNLILWLDQAHIFFLQQTEASWMDEDGSILHRVADYDSYEATLYLDLELGTDAPAAHTRLEDLDTNLV